MADILVLGADGFLGSHLCERLAGDGHHVRAFDRFSGGRVHNLREHHRIERFSGDFLNREDLRTALDGTSHVVHLVSTTTPATSGKDPAFDVETNVRGTVELLELCADASVERLVFSSTGGAIYGRDQARPFREDDCPRPISPYAIGKLAIEGYLRYYRLARGLDSVALRISNPYGPRQPVEGAQGAIPIFLRLMLRGEPITVFGDGSMVRDYLFIDDLVTMMVAALLRPTAEHVFNVASGRALTVLELLDALEHATGLGAVVEHAPDRPTDVHRVVLDTTRFTEEFGVEATTSLGEGLGRTTDWVRTQT